MSTSPRLDVTSDLDPNPSPAATLAGVLDPSRLPTPPAIALRVVQAASRPDCHPKEIAALLAHDPALCVKLLKTVNSCLYGLSRPVSSLDRAVTVLGLNSVRSLALGLSLPAIRARGVSDQAMRNYWVESVGGAIIARELASVVRLPRTDDILVAGLLRDLGFLILRDISPSDWEDLTSRTDDRIIVDPCGAEQELFGVSHADVSAEILRRWNLPAEIVEPVRYHHQPDRAADQPHLADLAAVLSLASSLTVLDAVADVPEELNRVLTLAEERFGLSNERLVALLQGVAPKVDEFAKLIDQDIGQCPDLAAILAAATSELDNLNGGPGQTKLPNGAVNPLRRANRWPK